MSFNGIKLVPLYVAVGIVAWMMAHNSGVHATILGVTLGLMTPLQPWYRSTALPDLAEALLSRIPRPRVRTRRRRRGAPRAGRRPAHAERPQRAGDLAPRPHRAPPAAVVGVPHRPLFAFVNAGVDLRGGAFEEAASSSLALGVGLGLLVGKPVGATLATWIAVRLGAELPAGVTWPGIAGIGLIAGIGFTVALFVTELSFDDEALLAQAKVGIFIASVAAGLIGLAVMRFSSPCAKSQDRDCLPGSRLREASCAPHAPPATRQRRDLRRRPRGPAQRRRRLPVPAAVELLLPHRRRGTRRRCRAPARPRAAVRAARAPLRPGDRHLGRPPPRRRGRRRGARRGRRLPDRRAR